MARITADKITFPDTGATITCLTSNYASAAGGHPTITVADELWAFTSERSHRLYDELVPVPTRKISCRLVTTHAGFSAESGLLEDLYKRGMTLPEVGPSLRAGNGMLMLWSHQPVAPWQTQQWLDEMRRSLRPNQYLRMIENRFVTSEQSFIDMAWWEACTTARPVVSDKSIQVWAGIDASVKRDSTAIAVVTWDKTEKRARLVHHRIFTPSPDDPIDFEREIESAIVDIRHRYQLRECAFDPYQMASTSQRLQRQGIRMTEFPQTPGNLTAASQNLYELIKGGNIAVYPDDEIRLAVQRAVALEGTRGWRIAKEKQSHKIDIVIALAMAAHASVQRAEFPSRRHLRLRWADHVARRGRQDAAAPTRQRGWTDGESSQRRDARVLTQPQIHRALNGGDRRHC
jgi:phage terminase large subunit-like protein